MKAAKEKMFWFKLFAVSLLFCAPTIALGIDALTPQTRAELSAENGQNGIESSTFHPAKLVENYNSLWEFALESSVAPKGIQLSPRAKQLYDQGKFSQALDAHYEDLVAGVVKGKTGQQFTHAGKTFEIDVVTADKLIEVKRSFGAADRANYFSGKVRKNQLRAQLAIAEREGKTVEYWFKYGVHPNVRTYLESKGVVVRTGLGN